MLKKLSLLSMLLGAFVAQAQFSVATHAGDPIIDGQTVTIGSAIAPNVSLDFYVTNENATTDINMVIEFVSATNSDGSDLEICFGLCYTGVMVGQNYPIGDFVTIEPGQTQVSNGDHFKHLPTGSADIVTYEFRFFEVDGSGAEIGEDLTLTYVYDPALLGVNENNVVNASIVSTMVNNTIEVNANEALTFTMVDIQGRIVNQTQLEQGVSRVNVAGLAAQTYLVVLTNNKGASQTTKVIVK
jgi:hypothetical protein